MRRQYTLMLLLGAAGAGVVVFACRQAWAHAVFTAPRPLPAQDFTVTGQQLVPLASALALAALACLAAIIATRSWARRAFGVLLAVLGAGTAVAATTGVRASAVLSAARASASDGALGGSTTSGASPGNTTHPIVIAGSAGHALIAGAPWRALAVVGALAIILAGLATVRRGPRWPVMSARFDRSGQQASRRQAGPEQAGPVQASPEQAGAHQASAHQASAEQPQKRADSAAMWESLSRDIDPTADDGADPRTPADQLDGGSRS